MSRSPARIYQDFCTRMRRPGELNLSREKDFSALVGQFFKVPRRKEHFAKLQPVIRAWDAEIEKQGKSVRRRREAITDDLWTWLGRLYWNHAAWIILRGEYKGIKKRGSRNLKKRDCRILRSLRSRMRFKSGWRTATVTCPK